MVSGLDPSGGAGFLADARMVERLGLRAVGAISATTEQTSAGVRAVHSPGAELLNAQLTALLSDVEVAAGKLGLIADDPDIESAVSDQVTVQVSSGIEYIPPAQAEQALLDAGIPADQVDDLVENYSAAQLMGVKVGMLACAAAALLALPFTRRLPDRKGTIPAD